MEGGAKCGSRLGVVLFPESPWLTGMLINAACHLYLSDKKTKLSRSVAAENGNLAFLDHEDLDLGSQHTFPLYLPKYFSFFKKIILYCLLRQFT